MYWLRVLCLFSALRDLQFTGARGKNYDFIPGSLSITALAISTMRTERS